MHHVSKVRREKRRAHFCRHIVVIFVVLASTVLTVISGFPTPASASSGVKQIAPGGASNCLVEDGVGYCWGEYLWSAWQRHNNQSNDTYGGIGSIYLGHAVNQ